MLPAGFVEQPGYGSNRLRLISYSSCTRAETANRFLLEPCNTISRLAVKTQLGQRPLGNNHLERVATDTTARRSENCAIGVPNSFGSPSSYHPFEGLLAHVAAARRQPHATDKLFLHLPSHSSRHASQYRAIYVRGQSTFPRLLHVCLSLYLYINKCMYECMYVRWYVGR